MTYMRQIELPALGDEMKTGAASGCTHLEEGDTRIVIMHWNQYGYKPIRYLSITTKLFKLDAWGEHYVEKYLKSSTPMWYIKRLVAKAAANTPGIYDTLYEAAHRQGVVDGKNEAADALNKLLEYHH